MQDGGGVDQQHAAPVGLQPQVQAVGQGGVGRGFAGVEPGGKRFYPR